MSEIEDEIHFMLKCPALQDIHNIYIPKKYFLVPSLNKLHILLSSRNDLLIKTQLLIFSCSRKEKRIYWNFNDLSMYVLFVSYVLHVYTPIVFLVHIFCV